MNAMSEYIKKVDVLGKAVEVEYLGRPRLMVSVAQIGLMPAIEVDDTSKGTCETCKHQDKEWYEQPCDGCCGARNYKEAK